MNNPQDKFCDMAKDLEKIIDTCPSISKEQSESCKKARTAFYVAANKCAQYQLTTFEKKFPGELAKLDVENANTTTNAKI